MAATDNKPISPGYGHATHSGLVRDHNEDNYHVDLSLGLWVVADGMGGHEGGEIASAIVVEQVPRALATGKSLADAIMVAHESVLATPQPREVPQRMGSTAVALQLQKQYFHIAWVGDSRAYRWNGERLEQLTRDHSLVQQMIDAGVISPEEADTHPSRNIITQAIGSPDASGISVSEVRGELFNGDKILLCSDGLSNEVPNQQIADLIASADSDQQAVDALIEATLNHGASDNVTVLLVSAPTDIPARPRTSAPQAPQTTTTGKADGAAHWRRRMKLAVGVALAFGLLLAAGLRWFAGPAPATAQGRPPSAATETSSDTSPPEPNTLLIDPNQSGS